MLNQYLTEIVVAIIMAFNAVFVAYLKTQTGKELQEFVKENDNQHSKINKGLNKVLDYYNLNTEKDELIRQMHHNKDYFCSQISEQNLKNFAIYRSNEFITIVSNIVETYEIQVNNLREIESAFKSASSSVKSEMCNRYDSDFVLQYYKSHKLLIESYLKKMRIIISDLENHHKERFLQLANKYLINSIEELRRFQDVAELHWKGQS